MGKNQTPLYPSQLGADSYSSQIELDTRSASPPIGQYIGVDDQLFIMTSATIFNLVVTVFARFMMPDGTLQQNQWTIQVFNQRGAFFTPIPLPECFLLSCSVLSNAPSQNQMYVQATIGRGIPTQGFQHLTLLKGYVSIFMPLSWPWGVNSTPVDCAGTIRSITGTNPAAGNDVSETVPANAKWRLASFRLRIVPTAVVGNRTISLIIDDGTNDLIRIAPPGNTVANSTEIYNWADSLQLASGAVTGSWNINLPRAFILQAGYRIRTNASILAGDQLNQIQYSVEEWLQP